MLRSRFTRSRRERPLTCSDLVLDSRVNVATPTKLMIVAHPDDESLFGGEALTSSGGWTVVCVTNASHPRRRAEFIAAMDAIRANWVMLDHPDDLTSGTFHPRLAEQLETLLREHPYELVVTHNARGEYGHPQHRALHRIVRSILPPGMALAVFDHPWMAWPSISPAKRALLGYYVTQRKSIARAWFWSSRERLRRIQ
ncbi:MAG: PIG-L family deacetylase [Thermoanaerobaculia bacterium]